MHVCVLLYLFELVKIRSHCDAMRCWQASTQMALFGELRLAEKKSHRKYNFEFRQYSLSYRATAKVVDRVVRTLLCNYCIRKPLQPKEQISCTAFYLIYHVLIPNMAELFLKLSHYFRLYFYWPTLLVLALVRPVPRSNLTNIVSTLNGQNCLVKNVKSRIFV